MIVQFAFKTQVAKGIYSFYFKPEKPFRYVAGQFIELTVSKGATTESRRWFTLSSSPTEELLAVTTRLVPEDSSKFKMTLLAMTPGEEVTISDAMGDFILPIDSTVPLIFVAGGIGITPYRSMLHWLHDKREDRQISLFYGAKHRDSMPFLSSLEDKVTDLVVATEEHLDVSLIATAASAGGITYISGPEGMVASMSKELKDMLPPHSQIVTDAFLGYS